MKKISKSRLVPEDDDLKDKKVTTKRAKLESEDTNAIPSTHKTVNWTDGKRIFVNRLGLYPATLIKPHFLTFSDILHPYLGKSPITDKSQVVKKIIFSTYIYDSKLIEKVLKSKIPIIIIMDGNEASHTKIKKDSTYSNLTYIMPGKPAGLKYGVFHPKIILLEFDKFIRVVVSSANLTLEDWTLLSQVIWLQDFPLAKIEKSQLMKQEFYIQLNDFLEHCYPESYSPLINIDNYDYSSAAIDLIVSITGRFTGNSISKYGIGRMKEIMKETKYATNPILTYQTSCFSAMKTDYLKDLYSSWASKSLSGFFKYLEIQYPTTTYIEESVLGPEAGYCIILSKKVFDNNEFPRDCLYKVTPLDLYEGYLFHAKVGILAVDHKIDDNSVIYIGSHNISSSAWGKMEKKKTQLCISNYELGVIFKPQKNSKKMKEEIIESLMFKYPPSKYEKSDHPWIYEEYK